MHVHKTVIVPTGLYAHTVRSENLSKEQRQKILTLGSRDQVTGERENCIICEVRLASLYCEDVETTKLIHRGRMRQLEMDEAIKLN
jgi:hypothetical protein